MGFPSESLDREKAMRELQIVATSKAMALVMGQIMQAHQQGLGPAARRIGHRQGVAGRGHPQRSRCQAWPGTPCPRRSALELLESELFGHERGAHRGRRPRRAASSWPIPGHPSDEIGELSPEAQAKLLRALVRARSSAWA